MTELHATAFIVFILLLAILYLLFSIWLTDREIKRIREIRCIAQTQKDFGIARNKLFTLLKSGDLDDESITFLHFYALNTLVMRNPDKYKKIADAMRVSYFGKSGEKSPVVAELEKESKSWSPAVREMVGLNIQAINSLMVLHSSLLRIIVDFAKIILPLLKVIIHHEIRLFTATSKMVAKQDSAMKTFVESKEELRHLACA